MSIDKFTITILESNLNLFNSKSLISYTIKGFLKSTSAAQPSIKKIHHAERIVYKSSVQTVIEITPVVKLKNRKSYAGEFIPFEITNEHVIQSMHWGPNIITFTCGAFTKEITIHQGK